MHRFKDDPEHGKSLLRFRDSTVRPEDIEHYNKRKVTDVTELPEEPRMDPVLRLYTGCRTLLPENSDVAEGKANGTQAKFQKAVLKPGITPRIVLVEGVPFNAVFASEVDHVVLHHINERIQPQTFSLKPKEHRFDAQILIPDAHSYKGKQREALRMTAF